MLIRPSNLLCRAFEKLGEFATLRHGLAVVAGTPRSILRGPKHLFRKSNRAQQSCRVLGGPPENAWLGDKDSHSRLFQLSNTWRRGVTSVGWLLWADTRWILAAAPHPTPATVSGRCLCCQSVRHTFRHSCQEPANSRDVLSLAS